MSEKFNIPTPEISLRERVAQLPQWEKLRTIEVRVWSHSDFWKVEVQNMLKGLWDYPILVRIASAHRTPEAMMEIAKAFPNVLVSFEWEDTDFTKVSPEARALCERLEIVTCIAAAGWSAHIAGMTASDTQIPVIGFPVPSSTNGQYESDASMRDMPPHIPNGVSAYEDVIVQQAKAIYDFDAQSSQEIYLDPCLQISEVAQEIIDTLKLRVVHTLQNTPQIWIYKHQVSDTDIDYENYQSNQRRALNTALIRKTKKLATPVSIVNPVLNKRIDTDDRSLNNITRNGIIAANRLTVPGLSMSTSVDQNTNLANSLLFAAQIIGTMNPDVQEALKKHSKDLFNTVRNNDMAVTNQQTQ